MLERGLRPDDKNDGELMKMIMEMKWVHFIKQPDSAIISMVREFYVNASADGPAVVPVRDKLIPYNSQSINNVFRTPNYDGHNYLELGLRSYNANEIIARLCKPDTTWKTNEFHGEKTSFPQQSLSRYGKAWYAIICSNIMPTHHLSDVTRERAILLFAIVMGLKVDIGALIQDSIKKAIQSNTISGLPHPSLITHLCKQAGVQWQNDDITQSPMAVIDHHVISRFGVWEGVQSHSRGEGYLPAL